jgi:hypothetical protein
VIRSTVWPQRIRSPLPLLLVGVILALILIVIAQAARQTPSPGTNQTTLSDREALTMVADKMRSGQAAEIVLSQGQARFEDGAWIVTVGDAEFHFSTRNQIVVPDNAAAERLEFGAGS